MDGLFRFIIDVLISAAIFYCASRWERQRIREKFAAYLEQPKLFAKGELKRMLREVLGMDV